jgi:glycosyltransferase involved in cell wall biosynthesis
LAPRVVIVTPAYNEGGNIDLVAGSVLNQTRIPTAWVIVDEESSDGTLEAAKRVSENRGWVTVVQRRKERGAYDGSFRAFLCGVNSLKLEWDYLVKLDADTTLPTNHLEQLASKFESDQTLGIASGVCLGEPGVRSHPRRNNRMYRRECWKEISFPEDGSGWDTVDEVFARLHGWKTRALSDLVCTHMRSRLPDAKYRFHQGRLSRHLGYYWWFVIGRSVKMSLSFGISPALAYLTGYLRGGYGSVEEQVANAIKQDQLNSVHRVLGLEVSQEDHART